MDLLEYRDSSAERERTKDLLRLVPSNGETALDIGARDGHFSLLLAERFNKVIALDLAKPSITHQKIDCVQGNAENLDFPDDSIDLVFCAEVLEHIPQEILGKVCGELQRVCRGQLLVGVPYRQDIRVGRTTCYTCMGKNPPWGHVNTFDEQKLAKLFSDCRVEEVSFVGSTTEQTNALSSYLMDLAGNPYGTYAQEERCIHCGNCLIPPPERNFLQKVLTRLAFLARHVTRLTAKPRGNWIHIRFAKGTH